jgi:glutathione synthase/RimK-type ligase-like ATP-grasp enzyme
VPTIVVIGATNDPHIRAVGDILNIQNVGWLTLDLATLPSTHISVSVDDLCIQIGETELSGCEVVWLRRTLPAIIRGIDERTVTFAQQEFSHTFFGGLFSLGAKWINSPGANRVASHKIYQLYTAKNVLGFSVPRTLITSNPLHAQAFITKYQDSGCVIKCLGRPVIEDDETIGTVFTTRVDDRVLKLLSEIRFGPCIIQPFVEKDYEVRLTVIGDDIFATKLMIKGVEGADVDWRRSDYRQIRHEPLEPPEEICSRCLKMCNLFNLRFGAFDFIVDKDANWYFLEVNPNGQWLWIQEMTGQPLAASLAAELLKWCSIPGLTHQWKRQ